MFRGIWSEVDPDAPDAPGQSHTLSPPSAPTALQLVADENERRGAVYERQLAQWEAQPEDTRGDEPRPPRLATKRDINSETLEELRKDYTVQIAEWSTLSTRRTSIWDWILRSVDHDLLVPVMEELTLHIPSDGNASTAVSLRAIVRLLKRDCAPSEQMVETSIRSEYREILAHAYGQDPLRWYGKWHQAYVRARARNLPDVLGPLAIQDFLTAVGKFAPSWASRQLEDLALSGVSPHSLEQLGQIFAAQMQQKVSINRAAPGVFSFADGSSSGSASSSANHYTCPCQKTPQHAHDPEHCLALLHGLRDKDPRIWNVLSTARYKKLRGVLRSNGIRVPDEGEVNASTWNTNEAPPSAAYTC